MLVSLGKHRARSKELLLGKFICDTTPNTGNIPVSLSVWDFVTCKIQELEYEEPRVQSHLKGEFNFREV